MKIDFGSVCILFDLNFQYTPKSQRIGRTRFICDRKFLEKDGFFQKLQLNYVRLFVMRNFDDAGRSYLTSSPMAGNVLLNGWQWLLNILTKK